MRAVEARSFRASTADLTHLRPWRSARSGSSAGVAEEVNPHRDAADCGCLPAQEYAVAAGFAGNHVEVPSVLHAPADFLDVAQNGSRARRSPMAFSAAKPCAADVTADFERTSKNCCPASFAAVAAPTGVARNTSRFRCSSSALARSARAACSLAAAPGFPLGDLAGDLSVRASREQPALACALHGGGTVSSLELRVDIANVSIDGVHRDG